MVLLPFLCRAQEAEDLTILPGFRVEKILNVNRAVDCQGIGFDSEGNLIVASYMWKLHKITPAGEVSTLARFSPLKGPNPRDIEVVQDVIYFTHTDGRTDPGLYRLENGEPVRVTPPGYWIRLIVPDGSGGFYAKGGLVGGPSNLLKLSDPGSDGFFEMVEYIIPSFGFSGLDVYGGYVYLSRSGPIPNVGWIKKYNFVTQELEPVVDGLNYPVELEIDSGGNMYTTVFMEKRTEGLGEYNYRDIIRISPGIPAVPVTVAEDIVTGVYLSLSPDDDVLYISEFSRGLVSRLEYNGTRTYVNTDYGLNSPSGLGFDLLGNPYLSSFRLSRLYRLDPDLKTLTPITDPLGNSNQTIAVDKQGMFYVSNGSPTALYKINPLTGDVEFLKDVWTRTLEFDSFGRLVITTQVQPGPSYDDYTSTVGIMDLISFAITPYITGIKNLERGFLFDEDQNFYVKQKRGDGIVKVSIPMDPSGEPVDISKDETLFVDLTSKDSEIRYFDRTVDGKLLIPLNGLGELVLAEADGTWTDFASGFSWPGHVNFDSNGIAYIVDGDNGIFRIIGEEFVVPAIVKRNRDLYAEVSDRVSNNGIKNSLMKKLANANKALERGNIKAAINIMESF
ncbi:MAG: hypothetical protein V3R45_07880, partial [Candidatus Aminicenantaceae bacterium]